MDLGITELRDLGVWGFGDFKGSSRILRVLIDFKGIMGFEGI